MESILGSLLTAGASIFGGLATNSANAAINSNNLAYNSMAMHDMQQFNHAEGDYARWFAAERQEDSQAFAMEAQARQNQFNWDAQQNAQGFSAQQAAYAREFNNWMAGTSYQRAANDLQAAGLNRILALGNPSAAIPSPSPTGSPVAGGIASAGMAGSPMASGGGTSAGPMQGMQNAIGQGVASAMEFARVFQNLKALDAQIDKTKADTDVSRATKDNVDASTVRTIAQTASERGVPEMQQAQRALWRQQGIAQEAGAGASTASAYRDRMETARGWSDLDFRERLGGYPGTMQGYSFRGPGGIGGSVPPVSQINPSAEGRRGSSFWDDLLGKMMGR